jgi:hypothetical protein
MATFDRAPQIPAVGRVPPPSSLDVLEAKREAPGHPLVVRTSACDDAVVVHAQERCLVVKSDESVRTAACKSEVNWNFAPFLPGVDV